MDTQSARLAFAQPGERGRWASSAYQLRLYIRGALRMPYEVNLRAHVQLPCKKKTELLHKPDQQQNVQKLGFPVMDNCAIKEVRHPIHFIHIVETCELDR